MPYEPQAGSVPAQVIGFLRHNPDEHLTLEDITVKFNAGTANIHTLLARALDAELLKRSKNTDSDWVYSAGPALRPVKDKDMSEPPKSQRAPAKNTRGEIDPAALVICDDPLPAGRASPGAKYVPLFVKLKPGQAVKCKPEEVGRVSNAMRKWIDQNNLPYVTRLQARYHSDGAGRVWLLPAPEKAEAGPKLKKVAG